jgi:hypothetical protein
MTNKKAKADADSCGMTNKKAKADTDSYGMTNKKEASELVAASGHRMR